MHPSWVASFVTDPGQFVQFPIILMEKTFNFVVLIMQQAFAFAAEMAKVGV